MFQIFPSGKILSLARYTLWPSCLFLFDRFAFYLCNLNLPAVSLQRSVLLLSFRHPFQTIWDNGSAFKPWRILLWGNLLAEDSASWRLKRFLAGVGLGRTNTRVYQISRPGNFLRLTPYTAPPSFLVFVGFFAFYLCDLNLLAFSLQRSSLLLSFRHPLQKIWQKGSAFQPNFILVWANSSAEDSATSRPKRFLAGVRLEPSHTLVYQKSRLGKFLSLAPWSVRPSCLVFVDNFPFDMRPFGWVTFSIRRCNLLNGLRHPFRKIRVWNHAYVPVSHVSAGCLLFCALVNHSATDGITNFMFSFALDCRLELTFQYDGICQLKTQPHRVQNFLWQECFSNPHRHSCSWSLDWGNSGFWCVRLLGHPALDSSTFFLVSCAIWIDKFLNWEI